VSNFIYVTFPDTAKPPVKAFSATLYQKNYEHEMLSVLFRDWNAEYDSIKPGSPVLAEIKGTTSKREFTGYVHHIEPNHSPGTAFTEVVMIGASFPLKQAAQKVYKDYTADQVCRDIASKHGLSYYGVSHPRIFDQIAHTGSTDWQILVRLAKQIGYTLRAQNTELYFEPILEDFKNYRTEASTFVMRNESNILGSTLYSFKPIISESIAHDGDDMKAAHAVQGVDRVAKSPVSITKKKRPAKTKAISQYEMFDRFNTGVVAPNAETAAYEAEAAELRASFPYRGTATVLGEPDLRPNMPVYLDGIGSTYSGYWVILGAQHKIVETERNVYSYTTELYIGTDSLGAAERFGGSLVSSPPLKKIRTVKPGIAQSKKKPTSKMIKNNVKSNKRNVTSFGKIGNRAKPTAGVKSPSVWKTSSPVKKITFTEKKRSVAVTTRLQKRAG
jgi:phage protein D